MHKPNRYKFISFFTIFYSFFIEKILIATGQIPRLVQNITITH